jgi:hypothetical protein
MGYIPDIYRIYTGYLTVKEEYLKKYDVEIQSGSHKGASEI